MKNKTTRIVDSCGRISLPGYIRELSGIDFGDTVSVEVDQDRTIHIRTNKELCCICGEGREKEQLLEVTVGPCKHLFCVNCARAICDTVNK